MPIAHRARLVVTGLIVASFVLVAPPARARVRAGEAAFAAAAHILYDDAPVWLFPGPIRGEPIGVSALGAAKHGNAFTVTLRQILGPDAGEDVTTRIAFFPPGGKGWGLEWQNGDTTAAIVTQKTAGTADGLPTWTDPGRELELQVDGDTVRFTLPRRVLDPAGVDLSDLTGTQIQHQETRADGSVIFQGSPIVAFGALIGSSPQVLLPAVGIPYDAASHAQTWVHVDMCPDCKPAPRVTVTDPDLEQRVQELEATTTHKKISVTLARWVVKANGWDVDEVRSFAGTWNANADPLTDLATFDGALCNVVEKICQLISGNDHEATDAGQGTLDTNQVGRRIDFTINGLAPQVLPGRESYQFLVKLPDGTSGAVWSPWLNVVSPPGVVTPTSAEGFYLDATTLENFGYTVDASKLSTITDANQLPVGDTTRSTYATNRFVAELMNFYTKPDSTDFASQSVDVFKDEAGTGRRPRVPRLPGQEQHDREVIEEGGGTKPTVLQVTSGGTTTTTAYFDVGQPTRSSWCVANAADARPKRR